jgi:predicted nucleotidyltransferase
VRITADQVIAGVNAVRLRDALRKVKGRQFDASTIADLADETDRPADHLATALLDADLITESHIHNGVRYFTTTLAGNALANASAARPVGRSVAERHLEEFLERVRQVNASDYYLYWVDEVVVFGSLLDESADKVSDVDVAVCLTPRIADGEEFGRAMNLRADEAARAGRQFSNVVEQVAWGEIEVRRLLKGGSRVISMTDTRDGVLRKTATRVVYRREG